MSVIPTDEEQQGVQPAAHRQHDGDTGDGTGRLVTAHRVSAAWSCSMVGAGCTPMAVR
jgi:hypothetical protein